MPFPVVLALGLAGAIAIIVFATAKRRLSTWLLIAAVCVVGMGGVFWSRERPATPVWTATYLVDPGLRGSPAAPAMGSSLGTVEFDQGARVQTIDNRSGPNRGPAVALFAAGGAMGVAALVMIRRRRADTAQP